MTANPYTYLGRPIRRFRDFYGRRSELVRVTDDVRNGQCVSVVGIRRIGKTSLLFQLLDPDARSAYQLSDEHLCVYMSCERLARMSAGEIYAEVMRRVCRGMDKRLQKELEPLGLAIGDFQVLDMTPQDPFDFSEGGVSGKLCKVQMTKSGVEFEKGSGGEQP